MMGQDQRHDVDIYNDHKQALFREKIVDAAHELDASSDR